MKRSYLIAGAIAIAAGLSTLSFAQTGEQDNPLIKELIAEKPVIVSSSDYKVLIAVSGADMNIAVKEWRGKGYSLQGGISVERDPNGKVRYYQAMVNQ